jgi:hypothetical protein
VFVAGTATITIISTTFSATLIRIGV